MKVNIVPGVAPAGSPADHQRRNDPDALEYDRKLTRLRPIMARRPDGRVVRIDLRFRKLPEGWVDLGPAPPVKGTHVLMVEPATTDARGKPVPPKVHRLATSQVACRLRAGWSVLGPADKEARMEYELGAEERQATADALAVDADQLGRPARLLRAQRFVEGEWTGPRDPGGPRTVANDERQTMESLRSHAEGQDDEP